MRVCEGRECGEEGAFKNGKGDACWFTVIRRKTTVDQRTIDTPGVLVWNVYDYSSATEHCS